MLFTGRERPNANDRRTNSSRTILTDGGTSTESGTAASRRSIGATAATDAGDVPFRIGSLVVDREEPREEQDKARVFALSGAQCDEFIVTALPGNPTVAESNPGYADDDAVVGVVFESALRDADGVYASSPSSVWAAARDPDRPGTPEGFAERFYNEHSDELKPYHFPAGRLREVER